MLFHEVGHALVDQWDIPVLGREEDAVDAFSTIFMTDLVKRGDFALAGAKFFLDLDKLAGANGQAQLRRRALVQQAACVLDRLLGVRQRSREVVYGPTEDVLPASRRVRCADEYRQLKKSWFGLLKPHLR